MFRIAVHISSMYRVVQWPRRVNNFHYNSSATMDVCNGSGRFTIEVASYNGCLQWKCS